MTRSYSQCRLLILGVLVSTLFVYLCFVPNPEIKQESVPALLARREAFHRITGDRAGFLVALNAAGQPHFHNAKTTSTQLDISGVFLTQTKIVNEIAARVGNIDPNARCAKTADEILNFVSHNRRHTLPMYESNELHSLVSFFTTFGSGFCDDAATMMVRLAELFEIPARAVWISKASGGAVIHVISELFCDGRWRVYDPDNFGVIRRPDGQVIDYGELAGLAEQKKLDWVGEPIIRMEPERAERYDEFRRRDLGDPWAVMLPGEKRFFFKTPFFITSDGIYPVGGWKTRADALKEYGESSANFVRIIPLSKEPYASTVHVSDYFPFVAAFLRTYGEKLPIGNVTLMTNGRRRTIRISELASFSDGGYVYSDLTPALATLEPRPSYSLTIDQLQGDELKRSELLTVHLYAINGAVLSKVEAG